jgi:GT2 family glycosyltransferase
VSPHVTLAILTRNRPDCLTTALDAARGADDPPDDIVVSDDSDETFRSRNREVVARHPDVRYVEGPRRGLGANENHLVANLLPEAEWVVFTGDDARLFRTFTTQLRRAIERHAPHRRIPTGTEVRNGVLVRPNRLSFLGFQKHPHDDYSPGAPMDTMVVQATALPAAALRDLRWLEVSTYGFDEVDMAHKLRKLGWSFVFEPEICLYHDQSDVGREAYPTPVQVARLYVRARSFSVYRRRPLALAAFLVAAPFHLLAAQARRGEWGLVRQVPSITMAAYGAWLRSLRSDWRHG